MKNSELPRQKASQDSDDDTDCLCEAFCADNLSGVGSSDCSCSDCAEAMLEAYNEHLTHNSRTKQRESANTRRTLQQTQHTKSTVHQRDSLRDDQRRAKKDSLGPTFNKSARFQMARTSVSEQHLHCHRETRQRGRPTGRRELQQQEDPDDAPEYQPEVIEVSPAKYDYDEAELLWYVDQRIKENLKKHKHRELGERQLKQEEEDKRKVGLEKLRYETKMIMQTRVKYEKKQKKPWNYQPEQPPAEREEHCHKVPLKKKISTGLEKDFVEQKIGEAKERREAMKKQRMVEEHSAEDCDLENCQKHQTKISAEELEERARKIQRNAEKYMEGLEREKKEKEDAEKLRQSKLRALALQAKNKLERSVKMRDVEGRSSFHLTIEHHSTFSDMRRAQADKQEDRKFERELKEELDPNLRRPQSQEQTQKFGFDKGISEVRRPSISREKQADQSASREKSEKGFSRQQSKISRGSKEGEKRSLEKPAGRQNPRPLQEEIEDALDDSDSKFYVWDMPLGEEQVKKIFHEAKLPAPKKGSKQPGEKPSEFREEVNSRIEENIKKKLQDRDREKKQNTIEERVRIKKEEIVKEYRRGKDQQTLPPSQVDPKGGKLAQPQHPGKAEKESKNPRKNPKEKTSNIKQVKSQLKPPAPRVEQQAQQSSGSDYENKATSSLMENEIFSEGDKKIFVLNSQMLSGVRHLVV